MARRQQIGLGFEHERQAMARCGGLVAGVDEVGRGPLAGPVVAAAVILDPTDIPQGLGDSKTIAAARRAALSGRILESALAVAIGTATAVEIDAHNIRRATHLAVRRALAGLSLRPAVVLLDGNDKMGLPEPVETIVRGDGLVASIAAASIVAKVVRDRLMARLDLAHPGYDFAKHAGYGVPAHRAAIERLGPSPVHRFSFAPVKGRWSRADA